MKHIKIIICVITMGFCSQLWITHAISEQSTGHLNYFADLFSKNKGERSASYSEFRPQIDQHIQELISIVNTKDIEKEFPDALSNAIGLLGMYRSPDAVQPISEHLTFQPKGLLLPLRAVPDQERYIAVNMLIKIGNTESTAPVLLGRIEQSSNPLERELAAYVIGKENKPRKHLLMLRRKH